MSNKNLIVTITGQTCAGKTTLESLLCERLNFERAVSTTTRQRREGEVDGENYHFISRSEFKRLIEQNVFVEGIQLNDEYYGITKAEFDRVLATGKNVVVVCEPVGQKQIEQFAGDNQLELYSIWLSNPPSVIAERFLNRFQTAVKNSDNLDKSFVSYVERLASMMTAELAWQFEAASSPISYNLKVWEFNEKNQDEVLDVVRRFAIEGEKAPVPEPEPAVAEGEGETQ